MFDATTLVYLVVNILFLQFVYVVSFIYVGKLTEESLVVLSLSLTVGIAMRLNQVWILIDWSQCCTAIADVVFQHIVFKPSHSCYIHDRAPVVGISSMFGHLAMNGQVQVTFDNTTCNGINKLV